MAMATLTALAYSFLKEHYSSTSASGFQCWVPTAGGPPFFGPYAPDPHAPPRTHPRDSRGWLVCARCGEASEYAEAPAAGPFVCGSCRAER